MATTQYEAKVRYDGRLHAFTIPDLELPVCQACGERVFTEKVDVQINDALRAHLGLLTPVQIRDAIKRLGMSQKDVAARLGIAEATLSRWLNEIQMQSRAMDNFLRVFFALPEVRQLLHGDSSNSDTAPLEDCGKLRPVGSQDTICLKPPRQPGLPSFCPAERAPFADLVA